MPLRLAEAVNYASTPAGPKACCHRSLGWLLATELDAYPKGPSVNILRSVGFGIGNAQYALGQVLPV